MTGSIKKSDSGLGTVITPFSSNYISQIKKTNNKTYVRPVLSDIPLGYTIRTEVDTRKLTKLKHGRAI